MPNLSLRDLDAATLARIRSVARRRRMSVNRLILETLREQYAGREREFHDLDALQGAWSRAQAAAFDAAIAPLAEVEPALWAAEPKGIYRVRAARKRRARR